MWRGIQNGSEEVRGPYMERYPERIRRGKRSLCEEVPRKDKKRSEVPIWRGIQNG